MAMNRFALDADSQPSDPLPPFTATRRLALELEVAEAVFRAATEASCIAETAAIDAAYRARALADVQASNARRIAIAAAHARFDASGEALDEWSEHDD
jgi:hypothetical protein